MSAARLAYRRLALALAAALLLPGPGCDRKDGRAPNLLLVSVDTLRADHLGAYGAPPGLTPELDALARESVVYERAFSPASHTLPSIAALLTGREPEEVGVLSNRTVLPQAVPTLATLLWLRGYRTGAVVSSAVLVPEAGFARGFDRYDSSLPQREAIRHVPERLGKDTTDAALELLDELAADEDRPFFLWVHFQDPHGPYTPPPEYAETPRPPVAAPDHPVPLGTDISGLGQIPSYQVLNGSRDPSVYRTAYAGEVRYVDAQGCYRRLPERGILVL